MSYNEAVLPVKLTQSTECLHSTVSQYVLWVIVNRERTISLEGVREGPPAVQLVLGGYPGGPVRRKPCHDDDEDVGQD